MEGFMVQHSGVICSAILLAALALLSQDKPKSADQQELRRIEAQTAVPEQKNDPAIAQILADDCVFMGARALSKAEFIENVNRDGAAHENGINPYMIEEANVQVHVFGDTAVVTFIKKYRRVQDRTKGFKEDGTHVFTREAGKLRLRFTRIAPVQTQSVSS
jgi:ketosteroid isomerase-like protein